MNILSRLLEKRGIKREEDLTLEEKQVFDRYKLILTKEVTVENIKEFCKNEITKLEDNFSKPNTEHDIYWKACLHVYLTLLKVIEAPEAERESLERNLEQLIKS